METPRALPPHIITVSGMVIQSARFYKKVGASRAYINYGTRCFIEKNWTLGSVDYLKSPTGVHFAGLSLYVDERLPDNEIHFKTPEGKTLAIFKISA